MSGEAYEKPEVRVEYISELLDNAEVFARQIEDAILKIITTLDAIALLVKDADLEMDKLDALMGDLKRRHAKASIAVDLHANLAPKKEETS